MEQKDPRSNVTSLEIDVLEQIESYHIVKQELSKIIEKEKGKGRDVTSLEKSLEHLEDYYKNLSESLDKLDISDN